MSTRADGTGLLTARWAWLIAVVLIATTGGCQRGQETLVAPVSGQVLLDGQPVANAKVLFIPMNELSPGGQLLSLSYGKTNAEGKFTMRLSRFQHGAAIGMNQVWITTRDESDAEPDSENGPAETIPERIPEIYNVKTTLTYTVLADQANEAQFSLLSQPQDP